MVPTVSRAELRSKALAGRRRSAGLNSGARHWLDADTRDERPNRVLDRPAGLDLDWRMIDHERERELRNCAWTRRYAHHGLRARAECVYVCVPCHKFNCAQQILTPREHVAGKACNA